MSFFINAKLAVLACALVTALGTVFLERHAAASSLFDRGNFSALTPYHSFYIKQAPRGGGPASLAATTVAATQGVAASQTPGSTYLIGPLDVLQITVRDEPDLSITGAVRPDGRITVPLVEDIVAANKTPEQLAREIEQSLQSYVKNPSVLVEVIQGTGPPQRQVRIVGSAEQLAAVPYRDGMTLLDVIIEVGGASPFAAPNRAVIVRRTVDGVDEIPVRLGDLIGEGDPTANVAMQPGDTVMIPEGFFSGEWQASGAVEFFTTFTDNEGLDPDGEKDPALIFGVTPSISIRGQTARVSAALDASVTGSYQTLSNEGPEAQTRLNGISTTELSRDFFFVDAQASVSQQVLDERQGESQAASNDENLTTVQTYSVSPYLLNRLGSFANVETRYLFGATLTSDDDSDSDGGGDDDGNNDLSNGIINGVAVGVASGRDFTRIPWLFRVGAARQTRFDANDVDSAQVSLSPEYVVTPHFGLIGQFGYELLDDGDENLSGPTALGGFRWDPNPSLSVRAEYGRRLENNAAEALVRYDLGARTRLVGTFQERVETGQESLLRVGQRQTVDPLSGQFVDRVTGLAFVPRPGSVSIDDDISRTRTGRLTLAHAFGRNTMSVAGFVNNQETLSDDDSDASDEDNSTVWGANAQWARQLNPRTDFSVNGFFSTGDDDGSDDDGGGGDDGSGDFYRYGVNIQLNRTLHGDIRGFARYGFQQNDASDADDDYTENVFTIGFIVPFGL